MLRPHSLPSSPPPPQVQSLPRPRRLPLPRHRPCLTAQVADNLAGTINNTMPLPYAQLVALFVKFVLFMAASLSGITLAEARVRQDALGAGGFGAEFWGWWAVDTFLLMVYLCGIQGLSDLHSVLTTPYGPRVIDLPHEKHSSELRAFTAGLMDPPGVLPFP